MLQFSRFCNHHHSCLRVSFNKAAIIKSKAKEFFNPKILKTVTTTFFWLKVWLFGWLAETSINKFLAEFADTYLTPKLELLSPQNRYRGHQRWLMKDKRHTYCFRKGLIWLEVVCKHWKGLKLGVKLPLFLLQQRIFFLGNFHFWNFFVSQHDTCWIDLDLYLTLVYFIV